MTDHERDALLQKALAAKDETIASQEVAIAQLTQHNRVLQLKVDALVKRLFGKSSEKLDPAQLQMLLEGLETARGEDSPKPAASTVGLDGSEAVQEDGAQPARKKKRSFAQLVESLPIEEVIVDPAEVVADPEAFVCIGSETTKMLDHVPAQFRQQHIIRRKYVRIAERHLPPVIAPLVKLQERCIASPRLLANVAASRFEMHLPYYRIEQLYARQGLPVPRQTLCGWMGMAHESSRLVIEQIKREVFANGYVQIDETPVKYQDPEREGVCGTGYLWSVHNPVSNIGFMAWHTGRGSACLGQIVPEDFTGLIQSDGYKAYDSFIKQPGRAGNIQLAGCMAHARRKFYEAQDEGEDARWVLAQMQALYRVEARMREARAGPLETRTARQEHSVPILEAIHQRLQSLQASRVHLPRSLTGEAIAYALGQWDKLCVFTRDGRVQIDNNLVENAIRPSAIGKKNWLFMGDPQSGERAATFYTLIGNAHRAGLNAEAYLTELFERLPGATTKTVNELTPHAMAAKRRAAAQSAATEQTARNLATA